MKTILTSLFCVIFTLSSFCQASFSKAFHFKIGYKEYKDSEIDWQRQGMDVDILISMTSDKITIYSSEIQEYRILSLSKEVKNLSKWYAVDQSGKQCFVYFGFDEDTGSLFYIIEYSDYAWIYFANVDK